MQKIIDASPEVLNNIDAALRRDAIEVYAMGPQRTPQGVPQSNIAAPATQITSPYYDWSKFGYKKPARTLPTQVRKVLGTDLQDEVALSLSLIHI